MTLPLGPSASLELFLHVQQKHWLKEDSKQLTHLSPSFLSPRISEDDTQKCVSGSSAR